VAKYFLVIAAFSGFLAVALGAFGAHGLKTRLSPELMAVYQTAVQYHFYHTLALLGVAMLLLRYPQHSVLLACAALLVLGLLLFSGSLYLMALSGVRWLGAITPLGGVALLLAWLLLAWFGVKSAQLP
jgi:uncharacterized membrane protein YgdD (TMEM256/DUF423 family)